MALSTEWVALKTGQSGSGGVEYSQMKYFPILETFISFSIIVSNFKIISNTKYSALSKCVACRCALKLVSFQDLLQLFF